MASDHLTPFKHLFSLLLIDIMATGHQSAPLKQQALLHTTTFRGAERTATRFSGDTATSVQHHQYFICLKILHPTSGESGSGRPGEN